MIETVQAINASNIPDRLQDVCLEIDAEFPLHCSNGMVHIEDDGNPFSEWLKEQGYVFSKDEDCGWLGVWGT